MKRTILAPITGGIATPLDNAILSDEGVILKTPIIRTVSKIRGQHRTKPHSDRSSRVGQAWGRHSIIDTLEASSRLTGEPIKVNVLGPADCCPDCGEIPIYDRKGNLECVCQAPSWRSPAKPEREDPDSMNGRTKRNQNYQKNMRQFFRKGGR